jgi:hypothetical protein
MKYFFGEQFFLTDAALGWNVLVFDCRFVWTLGVDGVHESEFCEVVVVFFVYYVDQSPLVLYCWMGFLLSRYQ